MRRPFTLAVWLVVVWVALWEDLSWANLIGGGVAAVGLVLLFPLRPVPRQGRVRPLRALHFGVFFLWKLVEASAVVAWEVITPRNRINEGIVAIPIEGVSNALMTLVANAISLTPGTLTLEVDEDPAVLYVHVLHLHDVETVRRGVRHLERLAIAAFGPDEAAQAPTQRTSGSTVTAADRARRPEPSAPHRHRPAEPTRRAP